jgi:RNA polymerase sigma-70 factor (ECF subfamily)
MNTTSESLLERLRVQTDGEAWQRLVQLYEPWLRDQVRSKGLATVDVDDIVQEVMTVLLQEIPKFQHNGRRGAFRCWLRGITVNRLRELWRDRKYRPTAGGSDLERTLDQLADEGSELSRLWDREHDHHVVSQLLKAIAGDFEPRTWQAFQAFVIEGRPAATVAAELGMSQGAVWTAKSHVLKRLRQVAKDLLD